MSAGGGRGEERRGRGWARETGAPGGGGARLALGDLRGALLLRLLADRARLDVGLHPPQHLLGLTARLRRRRRRARAAAGAPKLLGAVAVAAVEGVDEGL